MRLALFLAVLLAASCAKAEPVKLRYAWVTSSDAPFLMLAKTGLARHEGVTYTLEPTHFQGSPAVLTALAAGEVDLFGAGFSMLPIAVLNAGMGDIRIIADLFQDGAPGRYSNQFFVLADGPVKVIADMKGHSAVTNAAGSAVDMTLRAMFRKHGIEAPRDVTIIEAPFPAMPAMLKERKVDLIAGARPFSADPAFLAYARPLFTQKDAIGRSQMAALAARAATIAKDRAAIVDYLEDELRALHWFTDPANRDAAVQLVAAFNKQPASVYARYLFTKDNDYYHDADGQPDLDAMQANIETERQLGFIKGDIEVKQYADLSLVEEAARRLK
jgi:NitT/TauT family transport system substrate-binding protein